jgi:hypothetical protein
MSKKWGDIYDELCTYKSIWSGLGISQLNMSGPPWPGDMWRVIGMEIDNVSYISFNDMLGAVNAS